MKLSFLGHSYEASTTEVDTIETQSTVSFLGRRSVVKHHHIANRSQPSEELTFLGHRYTR
ncbi:hypothetical protein C7293_24650 [filamentous cyanobacterium CCT1]|nr:hypothetical protein C7293_24650 [filamentous cyanobacterium CCT1]PSN78189.1 hypothetical protein C8B47_18155 [filamentous cyanobacterium CCP4]